MALALLLLDVASPNSLTLRELLRLCAHSGLLSMAPEVVSLSDLLFGHFDDN
jgi:hypothetical protein